jgi:hypothetical protein
VEAVTGDMHQIYLLEITSHLGMKDKQPKFPMKMLTDALKKVIFMETLHSVHLIVTYQFEYFMVIFPKI